MVRSLGKLRFSEQTRDVENSWHNMDKLGFTLSSLPRLEETWRIEQKKISDLCLLFILCLFKDTSVDKTILR